ncbi:hypothetical protein O7632_28025 [Solwaraspora sp. WMMD406]|uniref:hypothetical protein n=1 Tax=Solwaraspora sp. WMMD406 TaxID=3016095 RepID=UPI0024179C34|nr:hypothetical protein [Solwaraspora sp. WMMD406]MDG4767914.1 hypothetical protein [Solwaraspora sp. WMMD406]
MEPDVVVVEPGAGAFGDVGLGAEGEDAVVQESRYRVGVNVLQDAVLLRRGCRAGCGGGLVGGE